MEAVRNCVGCGYCCKTARCAASGGGTGACPYLKYDGDRYRCQKVVDGDGAFSDAVAIGAGCCSSLNSERRKMIAKDKALAETESYLTTFLAVNNLL